jgi:D-alanyl-D-alanine carboxypeptidase (penicillin-binding protein 5/6)
MEAVLLESANNVADSLAVWAFGSLEAYRAYAQKMVQEIGMNHTTIGTDASGYHPTTTSTASDLALLAREVLKEPMLRQIVDTSSTSLPGAGRIQNTNRFLGSEVVGMKTGYTPEAGGVFVLAGGLSYQNAALEHSVQKRVIPRVIPRIWG